MDATVIVAGIGAVPATLGAWAAVIAARRAGSSHTACEQIKSMLHAHMADEKIHYLPERRIGLRRERP